MTVVVGVDGSPGSEHALAWAIAEARLRATSLSLVHGWRLAIGGHTAVAASWSLLAAASQSLTDRVLAAARAEAPDLEVVGQCVERSPAHALVDAAAPGDLLVVGSRGHGRISSVLLGSVADACVRLATCPVAVVRRHGGSAGGGAVIVGVDGSETATAALRVAQREAAIRGAHLVAVAAWHAPAVPGLLIDSAAAVWEAATAEMLDEVIGRVGGSPAPEPHVAHGAPHAVLLGLAEDASLLVIGTRGLGDVAATLLGS